MKYEYKVVVVYINNGEKRSRTITIPSKVKMSKQQIDDNIKEFFHGYEVVSCEKILTAFSGK